MLVAFPTFQGDVHLLEKLLLWISILDPKLNHDALLVFDHDTPFDAATRCHTIASRIFREVRTTATDKSYKAPWPIASNQMFHFAAGYVQEKWPQPWLLCEPDAVPLRSGWLDQLQLIDDLGRKIGKAFIGQIEACTQPTMPEKIMSGVAIYPADTASRIQALPGSSRAWQVDAAEIMVGHGADTPLIRDFFGTKDQPPFFVEHKHLDSPINALTLDFIPEEAVLFHRDKTHSLIPLLAKKLNVEWQPEPKVVKREKIVVVFPVHNGDVSLAIHHAKWLQMMNQRWEHEALICYDPLCPGVMVAQLQKALSPCFQIVGVHQYPAPPIPTYPQSANWAFQSVAHRMAQQAAPWFWCEADLVVLKTDWLDQLQAEYERAQRSWMGPVVAHMGHMQGTSVYPADAAHRMPRVMSCGSGEAFDMVSTLDIGEDRHDCGHLIHHVWTILNGTLCPVGGGHLPVNATPQLLNQIPKSAVATHRWKDLSVIQALISGAWRP